TVPAKPVAQGAATDPHRALRFETLDHLVQCDVLAAIDHPENEIRMAIETGAMPSTLRSGRQLADLRSRNPPDRARYSHAKPRGRLASRGSFARRFQNPNPYVVTECSGHRQPPPKQMLNQNKAAASLHNRFIDDRTCSR